MPRTRKGLTPRKSDRLDARTFFIIATEGNTERKYFNGLKRFSKPKVEIEVLEREGTNSSPQAVIEQLNNYVKEYVLVEGDEVWLVIDRDFKSWTTQQIKSIAAQCFQKDYFLGLSNPCFELWLLLHLIDVSEFPTEKRNKILENRKVNTSRTRIEKEILDIKGSYNKSNPKLDDFLPHVSKAIRRGKDLDIDPSTRWIEGVGTRIYLLVEKLI